jgi:hypothetical protein
MDRRRDSYREWMLDALEPLAVDVAPNALISDELVMNVAFLIERSRQREFDARVHQLDQLFHNEITFRVIGPLPAYSFSSVAVTRLAREHVEDARGILRLGDVLSEVEIRRAYRRLAAEEQRRTSSEFRVSRFASDSAPSPQSVGARHASPVLASLRQASEVLLSYCRARDEAQRGQPGRRRAGRARHDGLFVVSIKGSKSEEIGPSRFGGTTGEDWGLSDED